MKTKTITKPAKARASAPKARAKAAPATKAIGGARIPRDATLAQFKDAAIAAASKGRKGAGILAQALAGAYGPKAQTFYKNAFSNHRKTQKVFPRLPLVELDVKAAEVYLRSDRGPVAGDGFSQRLFDRMIAETYGSVR